MVSTRSQNFQCNSSTASILKGICIQKQNVQFNDLEGFPYLNFPLCLCLAVTFLSVGCLTELSSTIMSNVLVSLSSNYVLPFLTATAPCPSPNNGGCEQFCTYRNSKEMCSCGSGFTLATDQKTCQGEVQH